MDRKEQIHKAAKRMNEAAGGVCSVVQEADAKIHLMLEKGRNTNTALCGAKLTNWEGVEVAGMDYIKHPNKCGDCEALLQALAWKALSGEGLV